MTQQLATLAELAALPGFPAAALAGVSDDAKTQALQAASELALGMIGGRYKRPLVAWETDLKHAVCKIALYDLLVTRGYAPGAGADPNIRMRRDDAIDWLTSVARQEISPSIVGTEDQSPGFDNPRIDCHPLQGWQRGKVGF